MIPRLTQLPMPGYDHDDEAFRRAAAQAVADLALPRAPAPPRVEGTVEARFDVAPELQGGLVAEIMRSTAMRSTAERMGERLMAALANSYGDLVAGITTSMAKSVADEEPMTIERFQATVDKLRALPRPAAIWCYAGYEGEVGYQISPPSGAGLEQTEVVIVSPDMLRCAHVYHPLVLARRLGTKMGEYRLATEFDGAVPAELPLPPFEEHEP